MFYGCDFGLVKNKAEASILMAFGSDSTSTVWLIWDIDGEAMKTDLFNTLGGRPTSLMPE